MFKHGNIIRNYNGRLKHIVQHDTMYNGVRTFCEAIAYPGSMRRAPASCLVCVARWLQAG